LRRESQRAAHRFFELGAPQASPHGSHHGVRFGTQQYVTNLMRHRGSQDHGRVEVLVAGLLRDFLVEDAGISVAPVSRGV
jgi:hypothetical protein